MLILFKEVLTSNYFIKEELNSSKCEVFRNSMKYNNTVLFGKAWYTVVSMNVEILGNIHIEESISDCVVASYETNLEIVE